MDAPKKRRLNPAASRAPGAFEAPGAFVSLLLGLVDDERWGSESVDASEANREVPCPFLHTQPRREHESLINLVHSCQAWGGYVFTV